MSPFQVITFTLAKLCLRHEFRGCDSRFMDWANQMSYLQEDRSLQAQLENLTRKFQKWTHSGLSEDDIRICFCWLSWKCHIGAMTSGPQCWTNHYQRRESSSLYEKWKGASPKRTSCYPITKRWHKYFVFSQGNPVCHLGHQVFQDKCRDPIQKERKVFCLRPFISLIW